MTGKVERKCVNKLRGFIVSESFHLQYVNSVEVGWTRSTRLYTVTTVRPETSEPISNIALILTKDDKKLSPYMNELFNHI